MSKSNNDRTVDSSLIIAPRGPAAYQTPDFPPPLSRYARMDDPAFDVGGGVALITGANQGLGFELAKRIAHMPRVFKVVLACRNEQRANEAREKLQGLFADKSFEVVVMLVDTEDTTSCRDFGAKWTATVNAPVDLFLMNAGGMGGRDASDIMQPSGSTRIFAMNVLGHVEMFDALSRANMLSPKCKVVYVGSETAVGMGPFPKPDLRDADNIAAHISNTYNDPTGNTAIKWIGPGNMGQSGYGTCKAIAALYFSALARRHPSMKILTVSPGGTRGTNAHAKSGWFFGNLIPFMMVVFGVGHPLAKGAERLQYGFFVDEDPYVSGAFVASKAIAPPVGKCVDYRSFKKTENVFGDEKLQDAAYEAVRRFMR